MTSAGVLTHPSAAEAATRPVLDVTHGAATWRALGTYVELRTPPAALGAAAGLVDEVLAEVDRACSRFREDSDLTRANRGDGAVTVSPVLVAAVRVAIEAAAETGGIVDPTLGAVLVTAGYDCTFARMALDGRTPVGLPTTAHHAARRRAAWADVVVTDTSVSVPAGVWLDLGASGKAFAADLAALTVEEVLEVPVVVGLGGDLRVAGPAPEADGVSYDVVVGDTVADLEVGTVQARLRVREGGLATSSTSARRWQRGGRQWHHLLDPRTGLPASGPWRTVTALGRTAAAANTASTAAVVLGDAALAWLIGRDVAARLVDHTGGVFRTPAWVASEVEQDPGTAS